MMVLRAPTEPVAIERAPIDKAGGYRACAYNPLAQPTPVTCSRGGGWGAGWGLPQDSGRRAGWRP